jgi:glucose-1-phosphate thymidylyltransferase
MNLYINNMKGVILAGGRGTRLYPCTRVINKHLLPIYDQPMIYYPVQTLVNAGCKEILIVTGGENPGEFMKLLKNGKELGLDSILYAYQENPVGGIADALSLAKSFVGKEKFCVVLGDNLILENLSEPFKQYVTEPQGSAKIFIKEIDNPTAFGVAEINEGKVINIIEKPRHPTTNLAVIGVYLYDHTVFDIIQTIQPSKRGELEITDVNMAYVKKDAMTYAQLDPASEWLDTGSFDSLYEANQIIAKKKQVPNKIDE